MVHQKILECLNNPYLNISLLSERNPINLHPSQIIPPPICICHFVKKNMVFLSASFKKLSLDFCLHLVSSIRTHLSYSALEASLVNSSKDKVPCNCSESQKSTCDRAKFFLTATMPKTLMFHLFKNLLDFSTFLPK